MNQADHDFTAEQAQLLSDVAKRMKLFAALMIASPLLSIAVTAFQLTRFGASGRAPVGGTIFPAIGTLFYVVIALYTISAATSLQSIAESEGQDVPRIINALSALKRLFGIQYWLIVIALLAVVLWMIGVFAWMIGVFAWMVVA